MSGSLWFVIGEVSGGGLHTTTALSEPEALDAARRAVLAGTYKNACIANRGPGFRNIVTTSAAVVDENGIVTGELFHA